MIAFQNLKKHLEISDILPFGKYCGLTIADIIKADSSYLAYLMSIKLLKLDKKTTEVVMANTITEIKRHENHTYFYTGELRGDIAHYTAMEENDDWWEDVPF